ncbi:MAG: hypothetical protein NC827_00130 [Candidatus Omnitrophica bacterium]|nr:hypothetical protein [Candidatus Omnitrophota bacterium]MCM8801710.1 hypothetical protein [Candidatus Omnitrophota bacterium]
MENLKKLKIISILFFLYPLLLVLIGKILILNGFSCLVVNYEENEKIKILMNAFYFLGLAIFFFCGGLSDWISKKLFSNKKNVFEKNQAYFLYIILMFSFLNIISTCGFVGFLICGNFAWLVTFSLINFLSLFSYFPTEKRYKRKIEMFYK